MIALRVKIAIAAMFMIAAQPLEDEALKEKATKEADKPVPEIRAPARVDLYGDPLPAGALARMGIGRWPQPLSTGILNTAISLDGSLIATGGAAFIQLWEISTGRLLRTIKQDYMAPRPVFSPDGTSLAAHARDKVVRLFDVPTGKLRWQVSDADEILCFSPDSRWLATHVANAPVLLWDTMTGKLVRPLLAAGHHETVFMAAFTRDGRTLVSVGKDQSLCRWDVASGALRKSVLPDLPPWRTLRLSPDGQTLLVVPSSPEAPIELWDTETGQARVKLQGPARCSRFGMALTPDGRTLLTDRVPNGTDERAFYLWDMLTGKLTAQFTVPFAARRLIQFMPDGRNLILASEGSPLVQVWDTRTGRQVPGTTRP
jgi:WD40 repeat protein